MPISIVATTGGAATTVTTTGSNTIVTIPAGTILQPTTIDIGGGSWTGPTSNITVIGSGASSIIQRNGSMASGNGLLNIYGSNITLQDFVIDGNVTTPADILYSSLSNPIDGTLDLNSSIWIHPGATNITLKNVWIRHTGGYAVVVDSRTGYVVNVEISNCKFENNRPHLFGYTSNFNFGSWTGGIIGVNVGTSSGVGAIQGLTVEGCTFRRLTGIGVWSWSQGFAEQHTNVNINGCRFVDIGRDGTELGNVAGGSVTNCNFHRIGYITTTDTGSSTPTYDPGGNCAVAIDTTGYAKGVTYSNNTIISFNGHGIDGDGLFESTIANNTLIIPDSSDPNYSLDSVASYGPSGAGNVSIGIIPSNSYYQSGGNKLAIIGNNIKNCGYWSILLSNVKNSVISGNTITHPSTASGVPIEIICKPNYDWPSGTLTDGNSEGATPDHRSYNNTITGNNINYGGANFAIAEVDFTDGTGTHTFKATDVNKVFNNLITGGCYGEFLKDANSGSFVGADFSSNASGSTSPDVTRMQREGTGTGATTKLYAIVSGTPTQTFQLSDAGFLNISSGGASGTGSIATGNRSTAAFTDVVATGKVAADSFVSFTDTTYSATDANLLGATYGLLRFDHTSSSFQVSTSVSGSTRVWNSLLYSGTANQISVSGSVIGFTTNITVTGTASAAGVTLTNGYFQSNDTSTGGFYSLGTTSTTFNAPSGGISVGLGVTTNQALYPKAYTASSSLNNPASGYGGIGHKSGSTYWYWNSTSSAWASVDFSAVGTTGVSSITGTTNQITASASTGAVTLSLPSQVVVTGVTNSDSITLNNGFFYAADSSTGGFVANSSSTQAIQAPNGGLYAKVLTVNSNTYGSSTSSQVFVTNDMTSSAHNRGMVSVIAYGSLNSQLWFGSYYDGPSGTYMACDTSAGRIGVSNNGLYLDTVSGLTAGSSFSWSSTVPFSVKAGTTYVNTTTDDGSGAKLQVSGFVSASTGFYSAGTASNAVKIPNGGVTANSFTLTGTGFAASGSASNYGALTIYGIKNNWSGINFNDNGTHGNIGTLMMYWDGTTQYSGVYNAADNAWLWNWTNGTLTQGYVPPANIPTGTFPGQYTITGAVGSTTGVSLTNGYYYAADSTYGGFHSAGTGYNTFQAPSGGGYFGTGVTTDQACYLKQLGANPNTPGSGYGCWSYRSGSTFTYYNTSTSAFATVDVSVIGGGVTSLSAGTGISVSGSTGAVTVTNSGVTSLSAGTGISLSGSTGGITVTNNGVTSLGGSTGALSLSAGTGVSVSGLTISIGQAVATSSAVTFGSVTTSGSTPVFQSGASGTTIAFQTTNFNFEVNGNGVVSATQLNAGGYTCINNLGQFTGNGVACTSAGIGGSGFSVYSGGWVAGGSFYFNDQAGTSHRVIGGILVY